MQQLKAKHATAQITKGQSHRKLDMSARLFLLVCSCLSCTLEPSSPSGSNETDLLSRRSIPAYCRGMTNMLVVTTTMRMLYRVHSHTTNLQARHIYHISQKIFVQGVSDNSELAFLSIATNCSCRSTIARIGKQSTKAPLHMT